MKPLRDAHRHIGRMPAYPFYGGPAITADVTAKGTVDELIADLDAAGIERALVLPNYGVPDPDDRLRPQRPRPRGRAARRPDPLRPVGLAEAHGRRTQRQGARAGRRAGRGRAEDQLPARRPPQRPRLQASAGRRSSPRPASTTWSSTSTPARAPPPTSTRSAQLVEEYAGPDGVPIHLVHLGGGMSGHMKLIGGRLFDWIERGNQVYTDTSWAIGFAPGWLVQEIERRGIGHDRVLFATDAPWGDFEGEYARLRGRGRRRCTRRRLLPRQLLGPLRLRFRNDADTAVSHGGAFTASSAARSPAALFSHLFPRSV